MNSEPAQSTLAARLRGGTWFQGLPQDLQEQLLALGRVRRLAAGRRLFGRGDAPDGLYCVLDGAIRISNSSSEGREALLTIIESPQWFGEITLFDARQRTHDALAETAAELFFLSQDGLLELLARHPAWWREFALLLTQKLRLAFLLVEETALLPAAGRVARRLVIMAEGYGEWKDRSRRMLAISQEQLALMLALSRQTVNQILKQFEAQGALRLVRGGIEIVDLELLRGLVA